MNSLRETQKKQRREAILMAATQLFDRNGYTATKVEQIAESAGVSPPTVFNYFGNKQEILFALVERVDRYAFNDIRSQMAAFDNAVDALCNLQAMIMKYELEALPISIWRELMSFSFNGLVSEAMTDLNTHLVKEIAELLRELQGRDMVNNDVDPEVVANLLNDYATLLFARFVHEDKPDRQAHAKNVRRALEMTFTGLRP